MNFRLETLFEKKFIAFCNLPEGLGHKHKVKRFCCKKKFFNFQKMDILFYFIKI